MDIAFENRNGTGFDFATDGYDLLVGDGLINMLIHALFRDARAPEGTIPTGTDPRGHWATGLTADAPEGSLLWRLSREKITPDMPHQVSETLEQACQFMVEDTEGDARNVTSVRAIGQKASHRGRIEAQLNVYLSGVATPRRFTFVYDPATKRYELEEID